MAVNLSRTGMREVLDETAEAITKRSAMFRLLIRIRLTWDHLANMKALRDVGV